MWIRRQSDNAYFNIEQALSLKVSPDRTELVVTFDLTRDPVILKFENVQALEHALSYLGEPGVQTAR